MKAFPVTTPCADFGMDLRDYFAAKAMQSIIRAEGELWTDNTIKLIALRSYAMADFMMAIREIK